MKCIIEKTEFGYSAYLVDVVDCIRTGPTAEEAVRLIREALCLHFQANPDSIPLDFRSRGWRCWVDSPFPLGSLSTTED